MVIELLLRIVISPYIRAKFIGFCGATVGKNVRIYEANFINLDNGFKNLYIGNDVHIGMDCLIDLKGSVIIQHGTTISPGVTILTHSDPGSQHNSPLCREFTPRSSDVQIGEYCWIGANSTILSGSNIEDCVVVGACSLVRGSLDSRAVYYGVPVVKKRSILTGQFS